MALVNLKPGLNDVIQSRIVCTCADQIGMNVIHHKVVSITTLGATLSEIAEAMSGALHGFYKSWLPSVASFYGVGCRVLNPPITLEATHTGDAGVGTFGTDVAPKQASGIISERTDTGGPGFRGRMFIPFVPTNGLSTSGTLTVGGVAQLNDIATALDVVFTTVGVTGSTTMQLVIRHTIAHGVPVVGLSTTPVTQLAASSRVATQRRRGQYGKANAPPF